MSTKSSLFYGRWGHVFMEQGECAFYWERPIGAPSWMPRGWWRLPVQSFWGWLNRRRG